MLPGTSWLALVTASQASSGLPLRSRSSAFLNSFSAALRSLLETADFTPSFGEADFGPPAAKQFMQRKSDRMAKQLFIAEDSLYRHSERFHGAILRRNYLSS